MFTRYLFFVFSFLLIIVFGAVAQEDEFESWWEESQEFVVTASKREQKIEEAPSFGANNIGEVLRMVSGIEIIQGGNENYEVSAVLAKRLINK